MATRFGGGSQYSGAVRGAGYITDPYDRRVEIGHAVAGSGDAPRDFGPSPRVPQARPDYYGTLRGPNDLVAGPRGQPMPQSRPTGPATAWYGGPPGSQREPIQYSQRGVAGPRARPHIDTDFPAGHGTGGPVDEYGYPQGWSNARVRRALEEDKANRRIRGAVADSGAMGRPRARPNDGRMPGSHNGRAINNVPRRPDPPRYDNRYGRPGTNNPPYPNLNDADMRHIEAQQGQLGRQRAFEARYDSGRYTPEQAAHGVDRQYGYRPMRPNDPGYAEYAYAQRYGGPGGGPGGNVTSAYGGVRGRPDNYGRSSVSGGGSFGTSPSPNR
jgi:hypothetical protein